MGRYLILLLVIFVLTNAEEQCCCTIIGNLNECIITNTSKCMSIPGICEPPKPIVCCCLLIGDFLCVPDVDVAICATVGGVCTNNNNNTLIPNTSLGLRNSVEYISYTVLLIIAGIINKNMLL